MPTQSEIETFIGSRFRSIWSLDLVQFLNEQPDLSYSKEELIAALRAQGDGGLDHSALLRGVERLSGQKVSGQ